MSCQRSIEKRLDRDQNHVHSGHLDSQFVSPIGKLGSQQESTYYSRIAGRPASLGKFAGGWSKLAVHISKNLLICLGELR